MITPVNAPSLAAPAEIRPGGQQGGADFRSILKGAIGAIEGAHAESAKAINGFLSGESGELHTAVLAAQKAEISLELFLQARNKVVQAYQEIMRSQI